MADVYKQVKGSEARITRNGKKFEILVESEAAYEYKRGTGNITDVLVVEEVFTNARKGERAAEKDLEEAFGTTDIKRIAEEIIRRGTINISTEYRNKLLEQKKKQVIDIIRTKAYNPKDNLPLPPARIENAMEEAKIKIDIFKSAEEQAKEIVEELSKIIPISMKSLTIALQIPARYAGKAYNAFKRYGRITKQEWQSNGSLKIHVQIPAGRKQDLISKANELTHGDLDLTQVS
jgi:ribosome maturation protein SDO1